MKRKVTIWMLCSVAIIIWTGLVYAQTMKPGTMKTTKLPSGEEVYDLNGEWDVIITNYGVWERYGSYPNGFFRVFNGYPDKDLSLHNGSKWLF